MHSDTQQLPQTSAQRIEELGQIIMAYSEITEKLQHSHDALREQIHSLRDELSEKNRLLERKNRLAALGEMAAGMAHEIRNPLGGIQLYASMLAKDVAHQPESVKIVGKISQGVRRLEALVGQVLHFSREIRANVVESDLADVVDQAVELASQSALSHEVEVTAQGPRPAAAQFDPGLMGQSVLNLLLNAIEAAGPGGRVEIRYETHTAGADFRQFRLIVRDTGAGIPPSVMEKIFNPFFTTKDAGTGLGLAIVHRIVEAHDGTITAKNAENGGALFEIRV